MDNKIEGVTVMSQLVSGLIRSWQGACCKYSGRHSDHVQTSVLNNGIKLGTQKRYSDTKIRFSMRIKAGSCQDPEGKDGLSHNLEHLMIPNDTITEFQRRGGDVDAYTNSDSIRVDGWLENTPENIDFLVQQLRHILLADITSKDYEHEKKRILNEIGEGQDIATDFAAVLSRKVFKKERSFGHILGSKETVQALTLDDFNDYKRKWFVGPNTAIGITGPVSHRALKEKLEEGLVNVSSAQPPKHFVPELEAKDFAYRGHVEQLYFAYAFPVFPKTQKEVQIAYTAASYLQRKIFEGIFESRKLPLYGAQAGCDIYLNQPGSFAISGDILPEDAAVIAPQIASILVEAATNFDQEAFDQIWENGVYAVESHRPFLPMSQHQAFSISYDLLRHGRVETHQEIIDSKRKVTGEDVRQFLADLLTKEPAVVAYGDNTNLHMREGFIESIKKQREAAAMQKPSQPASDLA